MNSGMLAFNICSACGVGFFTAVPIGVSAGFFLFNLCEYYSPTPINITVQLKNEDKPK